MNNWRRIVLSLARTAVAAALVAALAGLAASCGGGKESAPPPKRTAIPDLAGGWRSDIEATNRTISRSSYEIAQSRDSVSIRLVSTLSPEGRELGPEAMFFEARGAWRKDALHLGAVYWVSGKDTCSFELRGKMDPEGRLLLFFPADICGEKSLPFTRKLYRPDE